MHVSKSISFHFLSNYSFGPTRTPSPWEGIRKSDKFSAVCPQRLPDVINEHEALKKMPKGRFEYIKRLLPFLQNQSEDCLYLNVFSPLHGKPEAIFNFNFNNFSSLAYIFYSLNTLQRLFKRKNFPFSFLFMASHSNGILGIHMMVLCLPAMLIWL